MPFLKLGKAIRNRTFAIVIFKNLLKNTYE